MSSNHSSHRLSSHHLVFTAIAIAAVAGVPAPTAQAQSSAPPLKVGYVSSLSGPGAANADSSMQGARVAVDAINAANTAGRQFDLDIADDATDPKTAGDVCSRLVLEDKVDVIIGSEPTPARLACDQFAAKAGIPYIAASGSPGDLCLSNLFTPGPVPNQMTDPLLDYVMSKGYKKFYFIGSDYSAGHAAQKLAEAHIKAAGGTLIDSAFVPLGMSDFSLELGKIAEAKPQIVLVVILGSEILTFHKQFGADPRLKGIERADNFLTPQYTHELKEAAAGVFVANMYFPAVDTPASNTFKAALKARYGDRATPDIWSALSYEAFYLLANVVKNVGTDHAKMLAALKTAHFDGPAGSVQITNNYAEMPVYIGTAQPDGTIKIVQQTKPVPPQLSCKFKS
jgi:ABC-type branched-subunit amino acid transport system substrate-binding protein